MSSPGRPAAANGDPDAPGREAGGRSGQVEVAHDRIEDERVERERAEHDRADLAATLAFLGEAGRLKDVPRSAHTNAGRRESTAEHTWRLCLWIVALGERVEGFDVRRLLELAVVHDLGEALHGDTPAPLQGREPDREARERRDLIALTEPLPGPARARLRALWEEYERAATPEGRLARGLDKLETMLQHADGTNPPDFDYAFNLDYGRDRTDADPLTRALRELVDEATRRRMSEAGEGSAEPAHGAPPSRPRARRTRRTRRTRWTRWTRGVRRALRAWRAGEADANGRTEDE